MRKVLAFISLPHQNPTAVIKIDNVFKLCLEQIILRYHHSMKVQNQPFFEILWQTMQQSSKINVIQASFRI